MAVSEQQRVQVARLIGREPRGLEAIPVSDDAGMPRVIRVASLVDGKPFPTLFWLVDADLNYRIDVVEAGGLIKRLQQRIDEDPELQAGMTADHQSHIQLRDSFITEEQRQALADGGFAKALSGRGIGGIADFTRIRCLHTWYAAHLVEPNTVGRMLDAYWQAGQQQ